MGRPVIFFGVPSMFDSSGVKYPLYRMMDTQKVINLAGHRTKGASPLLYV